MWPPCLHFTPGTVYNSCGPDVPCNNLCTGSDVCFDGFCCSKPACPVDQCGGFISNPCGVYPISCNKTCDPGLSCINNRCQAFCTPPTCPAEQCGGTITNPCGGPTVTCNSTCTGGRTCINNWCELPQAPAACNEPYCPINQCGGVIPSQCGGADIPCSRQCPGGATCDGTFCVFPPTSPPTPPVGALAPVYFPPPPARPPPPSSGACSSPIPQGASNPTCVNGVRTYTVGPCHIFCAPSPVAPPVAPPVDAPIEAAPMDFVPVDFPPTSPPATPRVPVALQPPAAARTPANFFKIPQLTTIKVNGYLDATRVNFVATASVNGGLVGTIELNCGRVGGLIVIFLPSTQMASGAVIEVFRSNRPECFNETFPNYMQVSSLDGLPFRDGCGKMVGLKRVVTGPATKSIQVALSMDYTACSPPAPALSNSTAPFTAAAITGGANGALIGGIVGGAVALIIIIVIIVVLVRRRGSGGGSSGGSTKSHEMKSVGSSKPATAKPATTSVSHSTSTNTNQTSQGPTYTIPASTPATQNRPYSQPQPVGFSPQSATPAMSPRPATAAPGSTRTGGSIFTPAADVDLDKPNFPQPTSYVYYDNGQQDQQYQQPYEDQQQQYYAEQPTDGNDFTFQTFRSNKANYGNVQSNAGNGADNGMYQAYN
jgi:hypothetical protein